MHQRHCLMVQGPIVSTIAFSHLHDLLLLAIIIGVQIQPAQILCIWLSAIFAQTFYDMENRYQILIGCIYELRCQSDIWISD